MPALSYGALIRQLRYQLLLEPTKLRSYSYIARPQVEFHTPLTDKPLLQTRKGAARAIFT